MFLVNIRTPTVFIAKVQNGWYKETNPKTISNNCRSTECLCRHVFTMVFINVVVTAGCNNNISNKICMNS